MTWSIVAHDAVTGAFGVAVATCNFAVGASCPFVRAGVGAVSTQSISNRYLGPAILDGLARGLAPAGAIEGALAGDEGAQLRQVHAVDRHGRSAAWTGRHCVEWCGSESGPGVSVAGNMLAGAGVVAGTLEVMGEEGALPERMMAAMLAGERAGGDRRGRQSAAMVMVGVEDFPDLDLRVDDHADPLGELARLVAIWRRDVAPAVGDAAAAGGAGGGGGSGRDRGGWVRRGLAIRFRR